MAEVVLAANTTVPLAADPGSGHNRWHPDIQPIAHCAVGDSILASTRDAADGQLDETSAASDLLDIDLGRIHPLAGPVYVDGAVPGDLLVLTVERVEPGPFGYTAVVPGLGLLRDELPGPFLARWQLDGDRAISPDIPGVAVPAAPFLGIVGVAPDRSLLELARHREMAAQSVGGLCPPPTAVVSAVPGGAVAREGLTTLPPRENGGNLDVRQLGIGSQVMLPVRVPGGLFSIGDAHFAQGDGEVCGLAIETRAKVRLRVGLQVGGAAGAGPVGTRAVFTERQRSDRRYVVTTGLSISGGATLPEDSTAAARCAIRQMIGYLSTRGLSPEQAYALCSVAVDLRISQIVDAPHVTISALLPTDIFTDD